MKITEARTAGLLGLLLVALLSGCATASRIDTKKYAPPKTVVIDDFPDMHPVAARVRMSDLFAREYFSPYIDRFLSMEGTDSNQAVSSNAADQVNQQVMNQILTSPKPMTPAGAGAAGAVGGIVGGLIQMHEEITNKKAVGFQPLLRKTMPDVDFRTSVLKSLRESLEAKGIAVSIASASRNLPPRPHWPGTDERGEKLVTGTLANSPAVDADLLVQIVPVAGYKVKTALVESLRCEAGIGLALYNGRTREFIGWQSFTFAESDTKCWYQGYDELAADVARAGPALHDALLSLVPQVADTIAGKGQ